MPLLTDEEIGKLLGAWYDHKPLQQSIREAVRLAAERCAAICDAHMGYEMEEHAADACAAEIRKAAE